MGDTSKRSVEKHSVFPTDSANSIPTDQDHSNTTNKPREINGPCGLEPTRYGDWERNGRCIDF